MIAAPTHVDSTMFDVKKFLDAFIGGLGGLILANGLPCDGTAGAADKISGERSKLEEVNGGFIRNGVINLTTPACVGKHHKFMAFRG